MDKITKHNFHTWAKDNNWLLIRNDKTPEGFAQENFLTPSGQMLFVIYDLDSNLRSIALPMPQASMPAKNVLPPNIGPPPGFKGFKPL